MGYSSGETTLAITEAISDALEAPMEELPPLAQSVDVDALERLVTHEHPAGVRVGFTYAGMWVVVDTTGPETDVSTRSEAPV